MPVTPPKEQAQLPPVPATQKAGVAASNPAAPPRAFVRATADQLPGPVRVEDLADRHVPGPGEVPLPPPPEPNRPPVVRTPPEPNRAPVVQTPLATPTPTPTPSPTPVATPPPSGDPPPARSEVVSTLGMQVNNKYITVEDILRSAAGELAELPKGLSETAFRGRANTILQRAIYLQVENASILPEAEGKITDEETKKVSDELDKTLRAMIAEAGGSRKKLEETWVARGTTLERVLDDQRKRLIVTRYLQSKIQPDIKITRRMLYDYYVKHKADKYTQNKKVQMQVLPIPFAAYLATGTPTREQFDRAKAAARERIEAADANLKAGRDFTEVFLAWSLDPNRGPAKGIWPLMEAGSFRETQVEQAAFSMAEGQASGIIETATGFYLVKVVKIEGGNVVSFEDAQEGIEDILTQQQYLQLRDKYVQSRAPTFNASTRLQEVAMEKAFERYWRK